MSQNRLREMSDANAGTTRASSTPHYAQTIRKWRQNDPSRVPSRKPWPALHHGLSTHQRGRSFARLAIHCLQLAARLGRHTNSVVVVAAMIVWWQPAYRGVRRKHGAWESHAVCLERAAKRATSPQPFNVLTAYNRLIHEENGRLRSHCAYCSLGVEGPAGL
jgi:hypothetical protein